MDDYKLNINVINSPTQRARDVKRVHDTSGKHRKEKKGTDGEDEKEFQEYLDETEKIVEGFQEFVPQEPIVAVPREKLLNLLGTHSGPPIQIEPIEKEQSTTSQDAEANTPGAATEEEKE